MQEGVRSTAIRGKEGDAHAAREVQALAPGLDREIDLVQQPMRGLKTLEGRRRAGEQNAKLIAADARHGVALTQAVLEPPRQGHQQGIAQVMSMVIIDPKKASCLLP